MAEVRRIDVEEATPATIREGILDEVARVEGVTHVVAFPDLHQKPDKEIPSSIAIATDDTYIPNFSSVNQNCGMCYLATDLAEADLRERGLDRLATEIRRRVPAFNENQEPVVAREDIERSVLEGAEFVCDRYDLPQEALGHVEDAGNALEPDDGDRSGLVRLIPERVYEHGRRVFGSLGGGNHFIELQVVSELVDADVCRAYGIEVGKVFVLYHTDSLGFGGQIGFLYGSRPTPGWKYALRLAAYKLQLHGPRLLRSAWREALFGRDTFNPVPVDSRVGQVMLAANHLNANFGYANRVAIGKWLMDAIDDFDPHARARLFVDSNHNAIRRERIGEVDRFIHRHNSVRVQLPRHLPADSPFAAYGAPVILPGFNDTSSWLAIGRPEAEASLWSADHGGAKLMARLDDLGEPPERETRRYSFREDDVREIPHRGSAGMEALLRALDRERVLRPLARLTPFATIKA